MSFERLSCMAAAVLAIVLAFIVNNGDALFVVANVYLAASMVLGYLERKDRQ